MNSDKINIRYQTTHYQPIYTGAGKSLEKLINRIDKNKFNIEVVTAYKKGLAREEFINGCYIRRIGRGFVGKNGYLTLLGKIDFSISAGLFNLIHRKNHIIKFLGIGSVALPSIIVGKILKKTIINKITAFGDDDPQKLSKTFLGKILIRLLNKNAAHWIISKEIYDLCVKYTSWNNLHLIPNPVDVLYSNYVDLQNERLKRKGSEVNFLFVGELNKRKGVHILIDLWEKYELNYNLLICGPLGTEKEIVERVKKIKNKNISVLGAFSTSKVFELFLKSNFLLFPSNREGLPNVVLEAMSLGVPVIAYNIMGVTDYLLGENNERGICVSDLAIENWKKVIEQTILENIKNEERALAAFEWIQNNSAVQVVVKKWECIYENIVHENH